MTHPLVPPVKTGTFRVARKDNADLVFDGELLADLTSRDARQLRWTEIRIYRADSGRYVTEMIGRTAVPGEYDRVTVDLFERPEEVRKGLLRPRRGVPDKFYLTDLAIEAIEIAAETYPELLASLEERI